MFFPLDVHKKDIGNFLGNVKTVGDDLLLSLPREILQGIKNLEVYKQYNYFKWPYWISQYINTSNGRIQSLPFFLYNSHCRTWLTINSFLSSGKIRVDPSGMIHPDWASWSLEFWMYVDESIIRFHDEDYLIQENDNGVIKTSYNHHSFNFSQFLYITHTTIDEAIIINRVYCKKKANAYFAIVIRPYTTERLSGVYSIEVTKNNFVQINDEYHCALLRKPQYILIGNEVIGDINFSKKENNQKVTSNVGMATMAFVYEVDNRELEVGVRIAVNQNSKIAVPKFDVKSIKSEYTQYIDLRMKEGASIIVGKETINEWVKFCKFFTLVESSNYEHNLPVDYNINQHYYTLCALNRMGYFQQSLSCINYLIRELKIKDDDEGPIHAAYLCNVIADYYRAVKDTSFLQKNYSIIKQYGQNILKYCKSLKHVKKYISVDVDFMGRNHLLNIPVIISALENAAFMSRSLGLFNDEKIYFAEASKLVNSVINTLFSVSKEYKNEEKVIEWFPQHGKPLRKQKILLKESLEFSEAINTMDNRLIEYTSFLYPFLVTMLSKYDVHNILNDIICAGKGLPLYNTIVSGIDVENSLALANIMLHTHDKRALTILYEIILLCKKRGFMPGYFDPVTNHAIIKEPVSMVAVSLLFQVIRNLCFIDHPERLELFPVPVEEWFNGSQTIEIQAPSRFGNISFVATSTSNECVIQFTAIPRFIPHDILINLPFKAKLKKADDFIIKYETERSWCINGWPSELRFRL